MMKIKILGCMVLLWLSIGAEAQKQCGLRIKATYQIHFLTGITDVYMFANGRSVDDFVSYMPSLGTGLSIGWSLGRGYVDLCWNVGYGVSVGNQDCFNQKLDNVVALCMGMTLWRGDRMSLDMVAGVGWSISSLYIANERLNYSRSLTANTLTVPFSMVWWLGDEAEEKRRVGLLLEYMFPFSKLGHATQTGFDVEYVDVEIFPSTLSMGVKYQF